MFDLNLTNLINLTAEHIDVDTTTNPAVQMDRLLDMVHDFERCLVDCAGEADARDHAADIIVRVQVLLDTMYGTD
jgi:hypothetical protein